MGFGIALAGGGTRGAAHVGILMALEEAGLRPQSIAGTSAGSLVAGLYAAGMKPVQLKELVLSLCEDGKRLIDPDVWGVGRAALQLITFRAPTLKGLIRGNRLEKFLCSQTGPIPIRDISMRLVIPAVDILTGDTIAYTNQLEGLRPLNHVQWRNDVTLCRAMRASASVPGIFHPVSEGPYRLVDGGISDNLPVDLLRAAGVENILAVDVSEEYEAPKRDNFIETLSKSLTVMESRLKDCFATKEKLLLKPELPEEAGLLTFDTMNACMEAGYDYTKKRLPMIRALFGVS
ncbi:MAG: patatin-like phospholipase family protein [Clostridiales bacterium]|nr:patatin-like phospholipase family protein [Clostridiales bacterium]